MSIVPFSMIWKALTGEIDSREKMMNVYAFVPLGMFLSVSMTDHTKKRVLYSAVIGSSLSLFAEVNQYIWKLGMMEADDLITNSAGTLIGALLWIGVEILIGKFLNYKNIRKLKVI